MASKIIISHGNYIGQISDSKKNGFGIFNDTSTLNVNISGQFVDDKLEGFCRVHNLNNQNKYYGQMKSGSKTGIGYFSSTGGDYKGFFVNGSYNGIGTLVNNSKTYTGIWEKNQKNGLFIVTTKTGLISKSVEEKKYNNDTPDSSFVASPQEKKEFGYIKKFTETLNPIIDKLIDKIAEMYNKISTFKQVTSKSSQEQQKLINELGDIVLECNKLIQKLNDTLEGDSDNEYKIYIKRVSGINQASNSSVSSIPGNQKIKDIIFKALKIKIDVYPPVNKVIVARNFNSANTKRLLYDFLDIYRNNFKINIDASNKTFSDSLRHIFRCYKWFQNSRENIM